MVSPRVHNDQPEWLIIDFKVELTLKPATALPIQRRNVALPHIAVISIQGSS
jgi:hypothetical protein